MASRREIELFLTLRGALGSDYTSAMRSAQAELKLLRTSMSNVNSTLRDISAYQRQTQAIKDNEERLQKLQERHAEIQDAMSRTTTPSESLRRQLERNETQTRTLTERMTEQREELERMRGSLQDAGIDTDNLDDATANLEERYRELADCSENVRSVNDAIDENTSKLKDATTGLRDMVNVYIDLGKTMYDAVVDPAIEYESAFAGVLKTVSGTPEELADLRQEILNMSQTDVTATASEIAEVAEAAGQLGIQTENIAEFSKVMIDLGESTNLSATDAAEQLAKFANVTKMPQTEFSRLGSVIVDLGNNMATTEADIVQMGTRLASTGELVGLSEPDIMAYAAALSSLGIEAEAGGTAASKMLKAMELAYANGDMEDYANAAGMTSDAFSELYAESKLAAISAFTKGLNDVERNGETAIQILDDMGITEVRYSNAVLALAASDDILTDAATIANSAWEENTALTTEAGKRYETTESHIDLAKNAVTNLGIELGELATPFIKELADDFTELAMRAQRFVKENGDTIAAFASAALKAAEFLLAIKGLQTVFLGVKGGVLLVQKAISAFAVAVSAAKLSSQGLTFTSFLKGLSNVTGFSITAAGAIAGVTVALVAVGLAIAKSYKNYKAAIKASNDEALFNNSGEKLSELADEYKSATAEAMNFAEEIADTNEEHEENALAIKKSADEIYIYNERLMKAGGMSADAAQALKQPFADLSETLENDFAVSYGNVFKAFSESAEQAADDLGVEVAEISGILDAFNSKYNSAIDNAQEEISSILDKAAAGGGLSQEDTAAYLENVEFMQKMSEARVGTTTAEDIENAAAELGRLDLGSNREAAIQEINDFAAYISEYTAQLNEAQTVMQSEFATAYKEAGILHDYGKFSDDEYKAVMNALAQAEASVQSSYETKLAEADEFSNTVADKIAAQISRAAQAAANDSAGKFDFLTWGETFFTSGGLTADGRDYYFTLLKKAKEDLEDVSAANDALRQSAAEPIEISVNAQAALDELLKVKQAQQEITSSDAYNFTADVQTGPFLPVTGYASGTDYAEPGLKLVGENGPELLQFRGGERVYNAQETAAILDATSARSYSQYAGASYNITVNPTFYGSVDGGADEYGAQIADEIIRRLDERERDARRNAYY